MNTLTVLAHVAVLLQALAPSDVTASDVVRGSTTLLDDTAPPTPFNLKVADAHVHLISTTNGVDYLWAKLVPPGQCPCKPPCLCNWTLADYVATSAPTLDVSTVIFCEVDAAHSQWLAEAKWVQSIADSASTDLPRIGAIIAQPPPGFLSVPVGGLTAALDSMRLVPLITAVRPSFASVGSAAVVKDSLDELGRRGLVVDLNMPLVDMASVVQGSPATRFVIEHMAKANVTTVDPGIVAAWTAKIKALAQFTNIECFQLGGVMHAFHGGAVDTIAVSRFVSAAVAAFGWGRVCFEGNWFFNGAPQPTYGQWARALVAILRQIGATDANLQAAFHDNTLRVYTVNHTRIN
eukprot:m.225768 g.225768  ORF g.225768 m.225768 type:complete len:349 (+) comp25913_c0_seq2:14-1060(+)